MGDTLSQTLDPNLLGKAFDNIWFPPFTKNLGGVGWPRHSFFKNGSIPQFIKVRKSYFAPKKPKAAGEAPFFNVNTRQ